MNKNQFIKTFNLTKISDKELVSYLLNGSTNETAEVVKTIESVMSDIPIELYKHSFETGTVFYISINMLNKRIVSEFYFNDDQNIIDVFDFIKDNLKDDFTAQSAFKSDFVTNYTDICLDAFNDKKVTLEQMNNFLTKLNDQHTKDIINYGVNLTSCLNQNKCGILSNDDEKYFGGLF